MEMSGPSRISRFPDLTVCVLGDETGQDSDEEIPASTQDAGEEVSSKVSSSAGDLKSDKFACLVKSGEKILGHLPYEIAQICFHFMTHGNIEGFTTGKRRRNQDIPCKGLEIPCTLTFYGKIEFIGKLPIILEEKKRKCPESWN